MYQNILAQKKPRPVEAIRWDGNNTDQVLEFCSWAKINDNGDLVVSSLENDRVVNPDDYVIKGANGEFYASGYEAFRKNYDLSRLEDENADTKPTVFMSNPKFVHTIQFRSEQFEDGVAFVKDCGLPGVELQRDMPSGAYKITHPTREAYEIKDGDNIVFDFKRLYPCDHDIFDDTYDTLGFELNDNYIPDPIHIFHTVARNAITHLWDGYYYEDAAHRIGKVTTSNGYIGGIGIMSLLRIVRDMIHIINVKATIDNEEPNVNLKHAFDHVETVLDFLSLAVKFIT